MIGYNCVSPTNKEFTMSNVGGGYIGVARFSKTSKNAPKLSTCVLFQALDKYPRCKKTIQTLMAGVNERNLSTVADGYCNSTIAWHITNGRIATTKIGRYTMLSLTTKGRSYAKERGIL